ncbi:hypothetical protein AB835_07500 [Candidatus Endobugula sertula]|uniref:Uncharacterized protein n=1 Tax=Candidatus Endobugula sertula TaxID=62101 RepID=A0A1D2QQ82_9GAMM|nr:hypothetical protein AB835_07500 [Candidatus Endobugula sertula]
MESNKNKALKASLSQTERQFGKNTVMQVEDRLAIFSDQIRMKMVFTLDHPISTIEKVYTRFGIVDLKLANDSLYSF